MKVENGPRPFHLCIAGKTILFSGGLLPSPRGSKHSSQSISLLEPSYQSAIQASSSLTYVSVRFQSHSAILTLSSNLTVF